MTRDWRRTRASCPASTCVLDLRLDQVPWLAWLEELGYDTCRRVRAGAGDRGPSALPSTAWPRSSPITPSSGSSVRTRRGSPTSATGARTRRTPPPATGRRAYSPDDVDLPIAPVAERHPLHDAALGHAEAAAPRDEAGVRAMRAQYYGMISEVDDQLGRVWDALGEDRPVRRHGGRRHVRPRRDARRPRSEGEARLVGAELPRAGDRPRSAPPASPRHGRPRVHGERRRRCRRCATRWASTCRRSATAIPSRRSCAARCRSGGGPRRTGSTTGAARRSPRTPHEWPWDRVLERRHLAVLRDDHYAYVQFGNGSWRCFDIAARPDVADGGDRPGRRAAVGAGDADVAVPARRSHPRRSGPRA